MADDKRYPANGGPGLRCQQYTCVVRDDLSPIRSSDGRPLMLTDIESAALEALNRNLLDAEATLRILHAAKKSLDHQTR